MSETLAFLVKYGYVMLYAFVLMEQIGPGAVSTARRAGVERPK